MSVDFLTLPDELQALANELLTELARRGYRPRPEPNILELPATPTIAATRRHETHYFLVRQSISLEEIQQWHRYCGSCTTDTRITVCRPGAQPISDTHIANLRANGVGLATLSGNGLEHTSEARDLA